MLPELEDLKQFAREAGAVLLEGFGRKMAVEYKARINPVTEYDRRSEDLLIRLIRSRFPHHAILGEENGHQDGQKEHLWIIDPLDGTTNFAHGMPIFAVSIAYAYKGQVQLGVVYDPNQDDLFCAERGQGAWLGDRRLQVEGAGDLLHSLLITGFAYENWVIETNLQFFAHFHRRCEGVRRLGAAALDLCYVAANRADGYWEVSVNPWDLAAGGLVAEEAGARVTRMDGAPDYLRPPCNVLCANPVLHEMMLKEIQSVAVPLYPAR